MLAIIKDLDHLKVGKIGEAYKQDNGSFKVFIAGQDHVIVDQEQLAFADEAEDEVIIFEAQYSRHPQDQYLEVQLAYNFQSQEFVSRIKNKSIGSHSAGHYYSGTKKGFHKAFSDFLHR